MEFKSSTPCTLEGQYFGSAFGSTAGFFMIQTDSGRHFSKALVAASGSLNAKGTKPMRYLVGSSESKRHWDLVAFTCSPSAQKVYLIALGSRARTNHWAYFAVEQIAGGPLCQRARPWRETHRITPARTCQRLGSSCPECPVYCTTCSASFHPA